MGITAISSSYQLQKYKMHLTVGINVSVFIQRLKV
jgi:hypothetical protein